MLTLQCHSCRRPFHIPGSGAYHCPSCGVENRFREKGLSVWEESWKRHPFLGFISTTKTILTAPVSFFQSLSISPRTLPVIIFAITCQTLGYLAIALYQSALAFLQPALMGTLLRQIKLEDLIGGLLTPVFLLLIVLLMPLFSLVGIVLSTALSHFILWMLRGTRKGIEATLSAVCYSQAAQIALLVPLVGGIAAAIGQLIFLVIGLKELHGITYWKSIATVLIPMFFCGCLFVAAFWGLLAALIIPAFVKMGP